MGKVKINRRLWGMDAGTIFDATDEQEAFVIRKGYGELVPEKLESKVADVKRQTKIEPELKQRKKKNAN